MTGSPRPLIGLTCGTAESRPDEPLRDQLGQSYTRAIVQAGGIAVIIPNVPMGSVEDLLAPLDGLVLTGGRDVAPAQYGVETVHPSVELDLPRDETELALARTAFARDMPILGICRGIQLLNVALGGTLYQDLPSEWGGAITHRQSSARPLATHRLILEPDSLIARVFGTTELRVNSFHHQAVRRVASELRVVGHAEDGLIEALEAPNRTFVVAVQYHPEEMVDICPLSRSLFRTFVEVAAARKQGVQRP